MKAKDTHLNYDETLSTVYLFNLAFSDYVESTTAVVVSCGAQRIARTLRILFVRYFVLLLLSFFYLLILDRRVQLFVWKQIILQPGDSCEECLKIQYVLLQTSSNRDYYFQF